MILGWFSTYLDVIGSGEVALQGDANRHCVTPFFLHSVQGAWCGFG